MDTSEALRILGLPTVGTPTEREIKQAYRDLAKVWHPDRFGSDPRLRAKAEEKHKQVNEAFEVVRTVRATEAPQPQTSRESQDCGPTSRQPTSPRESLNYGATFRQPAPAGRKSGAEAAESSPFPAPNVARRLYVSWKSHNIVLKLWSLVMAVLVTLMAILLTASLVLYWGFGVRWGW